MEVIFFVDPPGQEVVDWIVHLLIILGMFAIVFLLVRITSKKIVSHAFKI